ncbi:MAG: hypothetical protein H3Z50_05275 [archaeon]|nr:hypothetical protein [archaeon]
MMPVKSKGKVYSYLYYGHYDAGKYKRNSMNKSHIRWRYIGNGKFAKSRSEDKQALLYNSAE